MWIECGGDATAIIPPGDSTLLNGAACHGAADGVRTLLANGANVLHVPTGLVSGGGKLILTATDALVRSCASKAVSGSDNLEVVTMLLDSGADIDFSLSDQDLFSCSTPLMGAAARGKRALVHLLLRRGAQSLSNSEGRDAAMCAREGRGSSHAPLLESGFPGLADFLSEVQRCGGYKAYVREPRMRLLLLCVLCERRRATPPADGVLGRVIELPREVFWLIAQYWRADMDIGRYDNDPAPDVYPDYAGTPVPMGGFGDDDDDGDDDSDDDDD